MLSLRQTMRFMSPATRAFSSQRIMMQKQVVKTATKLSEVDGTSSLIGPGAKEGEVPTELEQATGLARLELLGKLEGIDVFDTKPLDSSRVGTMENPILVDTYDDYRYVGCTGSPAGSHTIMWLKPTVNQVSRCWECGSVYKVNAVGVKTDDDHHH
ncbi:LANO_0F08570g1_1 [Lachancea nothofagi CBS 11611]|uniref:Cytochrome c oxidase subunit 4, mitochondrial n=1 Tax=Lachancea nothofagi CBS 11611 TaxID=1266666 RepID=A0A1G4K9L0_9SACH|nr:LANO_0F08570g1_1 [Lachancea nothofagi CBS 11611]